MSKPLPTYPRTVFTLTTNYNVRKVTLVRPYSQTYDYGGYTARGVFYRPSQMFISAKAAIKNGRVQIQRYKKRLESGLALVAAQTAALNKAEATAAQAATEKDKS